MVMQLITMNICENNIKLRQWNKDVSQNIILDIERIT